MDNEQTTSHFIDLFWKGHLLAEHKKAAFAKIRDVQKVHDEWWTHFREDRKKRQEEYEKRMTEMASNLEETRKKYDEAAAQLAEVRKKAEKVRSRLHGQRMSSWTANAASLLSEYEEEMHDLENKVYEYESLIRHAEHRVPKQKVVETPVAEAVS